MWLLFKGSVYSKKNSIMSCKFKAKDLNLSGRDLYKVYIDLPVVPPKKGFIIVSYSATKQIYASIDSDI